MAKGQKRSNREQKKPKATKKPEAALARPAAQIAAKSGAPRSGGK